MGTALVDVTDVGSETVSACLQQVAPVGKRHGGIEQIGGRGEQLLVGIFERADHVEGVTDHGGLVHGGCLGARRHALRGTVQAGKLIEQCRVARDPIGDLLNLICNFGGLQVQVELRARARRHGTGHSEGERESDRVFHRHWMPPVGWGCRGTRTSPVNQMRKRWPARIVMVGRRLRKRSRIRTAPSPSPWLAPAWKPCWPPA